MEHHQVYHAVYLTQTPWSGYSTFGSHRYVYDVHAIASDVATCLSTRQELQDCELTFPIIADASGEIFSLLGLVREDAIDPAKGIVPQVCTNVELVLLHGPTLEGG